MGDQIGPSVVLCCNGCYHLTLMNASREAVCLLNDTTIVSYYSTAGKLETPTWCPILDSQGKQRDDRPLSELDEPAPTGNGNIVGVELIRDIITRINLGRNRYGTFLKTNNGRNALEDAKQELIDLLMYLKQAEMEKDA